MTENSAASAATAKPCPISDAEHYDLSTAAAIDNAFDIAIRIVTDFGTVAGEFTGDDDDKSLLVTLVSAKAGFDDIFTDYQAASRRVTVLSETIRNMASAASDRIHYINDLIAIQHDLRERIADLEKLTKDLEDQLLAPAHRAAVAKANIAEFDELKTRTDYFGVTGAGSVTKTTPEAVAERKLTGKMRGRVTVRHGDSAYDIEGTPEYVAAVRAGLAVS